MGNGFIYIWMIFEWLKNWSGPESISGGGRCPFVASQDGVVDFAYGEVGVEWKVWEREGLLGLVYRGVH